MPAVERQGVDADEAVAAAIKGEDVEGLVARDRGDEDLSPWIAIARQAASEGHADRAGFSERDGGGLCRQVRRGEYEVAGMGPVAPNAELAAGAPDLPPEELLRPLHNPAGIVATGRARPERIRHGAQNRPHVARIHPGTADLDHGIAGRQVARQVGLDQLQRSVERLGLSTFAATRIAALRCSLGTRVAVSITGCSDQRVMPTPVCPT
jgi:hypothetical protein